MRSRHASSGNMYLLHAPMQVARPKQFGVLSLNLMAWPDGRANGSEVIPVMSGNAGSLDCPIGAAGVPGAYGLQFLDTQTSPARRGRV